MGSMIYILLHLYNIYQVLMGRHVSQSQGILGRLIKDKLN